jgi:hypothetical protein
MPFCRCTDVKESDADPLHIVLDIDGTLATTALHATSSTADLTVGSVPYTLPYGCVEFLAWLCQQEDVCTYIFSAGDVRRNRQLTAALQVRVRRLARVSWRPAVYSRQHLGPFGEKNIWGLDKSLNSGNSLLIDDTPGNTPPAQASNVLLVYSQQDHRPDALMLHSLRAKHKLVRAAGILQRSLEQRRQQQQQHQHGSGPQLSWLETIQSLQWLKQEASPGSQQTTAGFQQAEYRAEYQQAADGHQQASTTRKMSHDRCLYEGGLAALRAINPDLHITPAHDTSGSLVHPWSDPPA